MSRGGLRPCTRSIHWPDSRQVGKSSEVLGRCEPLRLEAAHLTGRSRAPLRRFAADNPAHSRIVAQAIGVVHEQVIDHTLRKFLDITRSAATTGAGCVCAPLL
jgi:hypothetical protein